MRKPVELSHAYRLLNHGPTVLVTSAHGDQCNIMAAAWNMPLDFNPAKIAIVIDKNTYTREFDRSFRRPRHQCAMSQAKRHRDESRLQYWA